ncbi:MAG TPA: hypothetical protein VLT84_07690 [Acidobacteriota bacterium]|nr:hypothetical protein [Acidobacteriota bacterium]
MRRRLAYFVLLFLLVLAVTTTARAVPMLVEFAWTDASGPTEEALRGRGGGFLVPWDRNPNSPGHEKATHRFLTLWFSTDGKNWQRADAQITDFDEHGLKARWRSRGPSDPIDFTKSYGFEVDESGLLDGEAYIGVSTSSDSWDGGFSARLVSIRRLATDDGASVPEPAVLPLLTVGVLGLGAALLAGRRR